MTLNYRKQCNLPKLNRKIFEGTILTVYEYTVSNALSWVNLQELFDSFVTGFTKFLVSVKIEGRFTELTNGRRKNWVNDNCR